MFHSKLMKTVIKSPNKCSNLEIDIFEQMTKEGGQVPSIGLRSRIKRADKLIFLWENKICIAIAGLKNPVPHYKTKVFEASGMTDKIDQYKFEIGYIYAKETGVGNQLMQAVLNASNGSHVFATTQDSNEVMQYLLPKFGFIKLGKSYLNDQNKYYLGLFGNGT